MLLQQSAIPISMAISRCAFKGVKYDAEKTGYGFRSEVAWDNYISAQPTSCQMKRPS